MTLSRSLKKGIWAILHRHGRNAEISEELRGFINASVEEKMRRGMNGEEAHRAARAEMGSTEMVKHKIWSSGWESHVEALWQDVHYGLRQILRSPGISTVAILSLALGIGANTAIFTLINDLLLKELPVHEPQQLVSFGDGSDSGTIESSSAGPYDIFPYEFYRRISRPQDQFEGICAFASFPTMVSVRLGSRGTGAATQAISHLVSGNFFNVLGAEPFLGRALNANDTMTTSREPVAVVSHRYWQQALAADPGIIGRGITVNGTAFTVVGVMRPKFYGVELNEESPDMWLPITMQQEVMVQPTLLSPGGLFWIHIMARRKSGVTLAQEQSWVTAQFQRFMADRAGAQISDSQRTAIAGIYVPMIPGQSGLSHIRTQYQTPLAVLMGIVAIVLLIACANLANFLLAKAATREREFSTRLALGSSRARIVRQVLTETMVLAFLGGALGLFLAFWGTRILIDFVDRGSPHTALAATPDLRVLGFTSGICILTGVLFGIAPAWRSSRSRMAGALHANVRSASAAGGRSARLLPRTLVIAQVTLSLVLVAVAGLLLRTLHNLRSQDIGFNSTRVLLVRTNPKFAGYRSDHLNDLYDRILQRVDALPGVRSAGFSGAPPMNRGNWGSPIFIDGRPSVPGENVSTLLNRVSPGYFETLAIPLLRGRTIGTLDTATSLKAVVVNQTLANLYFPHGDALGHAFKVADPAVTGTWQIVGIVRDAKYNSPDEKPKPMAYLALAQLTGDDAFAYWLQIQTSGDPAKIANEVRATLAEIDPNLPLLETVTIADHVDHLIDEQKFVSELSGFFSLLALSLACIGLYGVMMHNVVRRTNEIGVRIALGASRSRVLWMVMKESLLLLVIGVGIGIPCALAASRIIRAGLFGVSSSDPLTLLTSIFMIAAVIMGAAYLPARRATGIDPMVALRYE